MTYTLALSPRAPALGRPQRVLLKVEGEQILDVEYRPDLADDPRFTQILRTGFEQMVATAVRTCPHCGLAHGLALCQAVEALATLTVPSRGACLRLIAVELERVVSHLQTVAAIFTALALPGPAEAFASHASVLRITLTELTGPEPEHWFVAGGVARDLAKEERNALIRTVGEQLHAIFRLADSLITRRTILGRTVEIGLISQSAASQFGLAGPLARASGLSADLRLDAPYGAYASFQPELVIQEGGDVYARMLVLLLEALEGLKLAERAARELPAGLVQVALPAKLPNGSEGSTVEGPRGPIHYQVESTNQRLSAISCRVAPQLDRLLARAVLVKATLDDAALIIISTDPCDACLSAPNH